MQKLAKAARLVGRGMRAQGRAEILEAAKDPDVAATGRSREAPPNIVSGALLTLYFHAVNNSTHTSTCQLRTGKHAQRQRPTSTESGMRIF